MKLFNYEITIKKLPKDSNSKQTIPKIGDLYYIPIHQTPFSDLNNIYPQVIIDVKDGYVRYNNSINSVFSDDVKTIEEFLQIYTKLN